MKQKLFLIGYSGHAFVCLDAALSTDFFDIIGYCDFKKKNNNPYNLNYLGSENFFKDPNSNAFISVGDNNIRKSIYKKNINNFKFDKIIHSKSTIAENCSIGSGSLICVNACINPLVDIGKFCIINTGAIIEHECLVRDFVHIGPSAVLCGNVKIGENTFIGANSVINPGIEIGSNCIIGSGSVVVKNVSNNSKLAGNPAKII
jgi:sugar O-acyltransferase (sialic acid O-acetyltransferase NeuD family)